MRVWVRVGEGENACSSKTLRMIMLRWLSKKYKQRYDSKGGICLKIGVTPIDEKMRESCFRVEMLLVMCRGE